MPTAENAVIPANAGIQFVGLTTLNINQMNNSDSSPGCRHSGMTCIRWNDGHSGISPRL